jgi:hypothetical protein
MFVDGKQTPSLLFLLNFDINCSKDYCKALGVCALQLKEWIRSIIKMGHFYHERLFDIFVIQLFIGNVASQHVQLWQTYNDLFLKALSLIGITLKYTKCFTLK